MIVYVVMAKGETPLCVADSLEKAMHEAQEFFTSMREVESQKYVYDECMWKPHVIHGFAVQDGTTTEWILMNADGSARDDEDVIIRGYEVR